MHYSISVGPLFVGEDYEFAGEFACPYFGRDSSDVFGGKDRCHVVNQDPWQSANEEVVVADAVLDSGYGMERGAHRCSWWQQ